ncbi:MAG: carboxypeptidase-like regulatory domain-containing protein [bacterium]
MRSLVVLAMSLVVVAHEAATAQGDSHTLRGTVFDSVAHAALPGAVVQAVQVDSVAGMKSRAYTATTDDHGRFKIGGVPTGRFAVGFQHDALNALGLESPLRIVELGSNADVSVDLAIPSGPVVRAQRCPSSQGDSGDGMVAGYVLDAMTSARLDTVSLELRWAEPQRSANSERGATHHRIATVDSTGRFVACGVASGVDLAIAVTRSGYRGVSGEIVVPAGGVLRRDFHLTQPAVRHGSATLTGRVTYADSVPVRVGHVLIPALEVDAEIVDGSFSVSRLPPGTWAVEVRALGFDPRRALVDLSAYATTSLRLVIKNNAQLLAGMTVVGVASADRKKMVEILDRQRVGFGTWFMPGDERLARADKLSDLLQYAAGFHLDGHGGMEGRVKGGLGLTRCRPTYFIDGRRMLGLEMPPMSDVLAVAAYPDIAGTPVNWRDGRMCAAIAIWTKH